jgi:pyruvate,water dikinase
MILEPHAIDAPELALLGGKARSLVELSRRGAGRVPPWFAVSADAFAAAVARAGAGDGIAAALAALADAGPEQAAVDACAAALAPLLDRLALDAATAGAVGDAYARMGGGFVAVRSSAVDEDGAERSFAGCLDTRLFVRGAEQVVDAVVACWRSAFSQRSLAYRAARGALAEPIRVAVVVQRMVAGEVSGVLFSADPSTGARDRAIVTSTWGLGEGVVSGKLACDTFVVGRDAAAQPAIVERDVVDKSHAIRYDDAAGHGTREVEVEPDRRERPSLGDAQLSALAELGWKIEAAWGAPVDVEWTWDAEGPWILQARPITTVGTTGAARTPAAGRERLWDNSNIIESYDGVTTPLTYSFARRAYAMVYRQAFELLGTPAAEIEAHAPSFEQMVGLLQGRVYYNLESWHALLKLLPGYKFNAEFMDQMMGVSERAAFGSRPPRATSISGLRRWGVELPRMVASLSVLGARFARAETLIADFFASFEQAHGDLAAADLDALDLDGLADLYLDAERRIMARWQAPIVNDILAMVFFGALRKALAAWGAADAGLHNDLMCGEGGLASTEPTRDLLALAADVRRDPAACALLRDASAAVARQAIESEPRFGWLKVRVAAHVARFGDRCIDELKLEQPTLKDDPTFVYATLQGYLAAPPVTVAELEAREAGIRRAAEARAFAAVAGHPARRRLLGWLLERARRHVKHRENLRFCRTRAFALVRDIVIAMGARLVDAGALDRVDDVFFLEIGELVAFARGTATTTDLRGLAAVRRREFAGHRAAAAPPERLTTRGAVYLDAGALASPAPPTDVPETGVLQGTGASPGVARAPARLVRDPRAVRLAGDVLVANRTDPGWVPLFPSAAAVVVERGSVLSHSAIVAREFGIPCVVGVRDALARLRDGQLVEVDGTAGTVTVIGD